MRGRRPSGPEYVESLDGSERAKQRLRGILETMSGVCTVQEACRRLDICEQRFQQLRAELLQAALTSLEPKPSGRPRQTPSASSSELEALRTKLTEMEFETQASRVRAEIAVLMPQVLAKPVEPEKKTTPRPQKQARPGWWKKSRAK
jgi:hypothetical protein